MFNACKIQRFPACIAKQSGKVEPQMLYKKAAEMAPTPIPNCMGGEGTVMHYLPSQLVGIYFEEV